jgi:hypothetical protein
MTTLYHRMHPPSVRLKEQLRVLAARYPRTKFTAIVGDKCIPNYPDKMLPTLILYRGGVIKEQLVAWGARVEGTLEGMLSILISRQVLISFRIGGRLNTRRHYRANQIFNALEINCRTGRGRRLRREK